MDQRNFFFSTTLNFLLHKRDTQLNVLVVNSFFDVLLLALEVALELLLHTVSANVFTCFSNSSGVLMEARQLAVIFVFSISPSLYFLVIAKIELSWRALPSNL